MNTMTTYIAYMLKFLFRIKWWLIIGPTLVAWLVYAAIGNRSRTFRSTTTIFTGLVSNINVETGEISRQDWNIINNAIDNLMNIIQSQTTLKNVSMRLYTKNMVHGDPNKDNNYLMAKNYRSEWNVTPPVVRELIDRTDEERTLQNLRQYEVASPDNHVYGLFHWKHRFYSYEVLRRIQIKRINSSDMLEISYENTDPYVVYNTLMLLNDEFVKQYKELRFGETNNVIAFFEAELARVGRILRNQEDSLRDYNIENMVINYDEQTKHIAALSRDFELQHEGVRQNYNSAEHLRQTIEAQLAELTTFRDNAAFIEKLHTIGDLQARITAAEAFNSEGKPNVMIPEKYEDVGNMHSRLSHETDSLRKITSAISNNSYTKEGISTPSMVQQWLEAVLLSTKSGAQISVLEEWKRSIDVRFEQFAPVGAMLKRKNREIGFSEQSYLSILGALNAARLRQKNLQMSSATLRVINPPVMPISPEPTKRKMLVIAAFLCTALFIFGFFLLLELLDRTLRDKIRAERITGGKVIGAFPGKGRMSERRYTKQYQELAAKAICNASLNYFDPSKQSNTINVLSTVQGDGKSEVIGHLADYLAGTGLKVRVASWNKDFDISQKEFLLAERLEDFVHDVEGAIPLAEADVVLLEFPSLDNSSVPRELLHQAALNLVVAPANRAWKSIDQTLYEKIASLSGQTTTLLCLNHATRDVVQTFTGLLPPYTYLRKLIYQFGQFGFTGVK